MTLKRKGRFARCLLGMLFCAGLVLYGKAGYGAIKVYPRLVTPGTASENNRVYFEYVYADEPRPILNIFDVHGRKVKDISTMNPGATAAGWLLSWDGKDDNGEMVMPGVYIYQWTEGDSVIKGAIVVAR